MELRVSEFSWVFPDEDHDTDIGSIMGGGGGVLQTFLLACLLFARNKTSNYNTATVMKKDLLDERSYL